MHFQQSYNLPHSPTFTTLKIFPLYFDPQQQQKTLHLVNAAKRFIQTPQCHLVWLLFSACAALPQPNCVHSHTWFGSVHGSRITQCAATLIVRVREFNGANAGSSVPTGPRAIEQSQAHSVYYCKM